MSNLDQAIAYAAKCAPSISGSGGHQTAMDVACKVVWGFALTEAQGLAALAGWNASCQPPWSEAELRHKVREALTRAHSYPQGCLVKLRPSLRIRWQGDNTPPPPPAPPSQPQRQDGRKYAITERALPAPMPDGAAALIRAAFLPGENVRISLGRYDEKKHEVPNGSGVIMPREEWLAKLDKAKGNPNKFLSTPDQNGIYIAINPTTGPLDKDVTNFRHVLVEFDHLSLGEQYDLIQQSNLPCTAILISGAKSAHAWIKVDAKDLSEYRDRVSIILNHFNKDQAPDPKNKNPNRFSRLPNCKRGNNRQELLSICVGCKTWDEWVGDQDNSGLPAIVSVQDFVSSKLEEPPQLILGILHQGSKLVLGGGSKSYKTWALMDMGLSVSCGAKWWNCTTTQGQVLYLNFEIQEFFFQKRIEKIAKSRDINLSNSRMDVWNLRGYCASIEELIPKILKRIKSKCYSLIIFDPIYKGLGKRKENDAGDVADLLNSIEYLAVESDAAIAFGAHFSKGNQATKQSMDRIGGSGVFARDPDSILTMTTHEDDSCFTIDATLRNFPWVKPWVMTWKYPIFELAAEKDPEKLAKVGRAETYTDKDMVDTVKQLIENKACDDENSRAHYSVSFTDLKSNVSEKWGMGVSTLKRKLSKLLESGKIYKDTDGEYYIKERHQIND